MLQVCLVLDKLYDVPCKIIHVNKGDDLNTIVDALISHFEKFGSPVMMGGDVDCSSKGIMGIHTDKAGASLLVVVRFLFTNFTGTKFHLVFTSKPKSVLNF